MELRIGRLIDHVHIVVRDLAAARQFHEAGLAALNPDLALRDGPGFFTVDELFVSEGEPLSHIHLAFQAPDRAAVDRWHAAVLQAGGRDNGAPGERSYHPGYYAAFAYDPDGNNIEAVFHGPHARSADSITVTADL
ncbi:Lactoylglutathione lyase [Rubellimicrobium mesophilum DSM 19309]|uniref:Lactoylglutathione lyase n=1 Tax=Rubellimicrobium mesophilum DSM 19309 TaxID=442562 RepID=A0A017HPV2_9RHOB|nr:VOC family protein [Rubellimicrobium mesophilum]EYD76350.1 Lactoylglutathione lyase [Rubellimicrobium mesophilum DSM 19309]